MRPGIALQAVMLTACVLAAFVVLPCASQSYYELLEVSEEATTKVRMCVYVCAIWHGTGLLPFSVKSSSLCNRSLLESLCCCVTLVVALACWYLCRRFEGRSSGWPSSCTQTSVRTRWQRRPSQQSRRHFAEWGASSNLESR